MQSLTSLGMGHKVWHTTLTMPWLKSLLFEFIYTCTDSVFLENFTVSISPTMDDTATLCGSDSLNITVSSVSWISICKFACICMHCYSTSTEQRSKRRKLVIMTCTCTCWVYCVHQWSCVHSQSVSWIIFVTYMSVYTDTNVNACVHTAMHRAVYSLASFVVYSQ